VQTVKGSGIVSPCILNPDIKWYRGVRFMPEKSDDDDDDDEDDGDGYK
jgi:hypothetical protein